MLTCVLIGAAFWLFESRRDVARATAVADVSIADPPPHTEPSSLWLRDGSARIRIAPHDIVPVASAGNYVEYALKNGRTHLIRGTLAAEERRLKRFNIVRLHRTRLINVAWVKELQPGLNGDFEIMLGNGQTAGSRRYKHAVAAITEPAGADGLRPVASARPVEWAETQKTECSAVGTSDYSSAFQHFSRHSVTVIASCPVYKYLAFGPSPHARTRHRSAERPPAGSSNVLRTLQILRRTGARPRIVRACRGHDA